MQHLEHIDQSLILFADQHFSEIEDYSIFDSQPQKTTTEIPSAKGADAGEGKRLIRIQMNVFGTQAVSSLRDIVSQIEWRKTAGVCIRTKTLANARKIARCLPSQMRGVEIFGYDPDYFQSLVPIGSVRRKQLEKFVLGLKADTTAKEKLKKFFKQIVVSLSMSEMLYENFLVVIPVQTT